MVTVSEIYLSNEFEQDNEAIGKLRDPYYLPLEADFISAFGTERNFESALEWRKFYTDMKNPTYEFLTVEYIEAMGDYLAARLHELKATESHPINIVELGAGTGRFSHFVEANLKDKAPNLFRIIATDSGKDGIDSIFPIKQMDYKTALVELEPDIVVWSWMPLNFDATETIRGTTSVKEYILIGDKETCGSPELTWNEGRVTADGFSKTLVNEITKHQICRNDEPGRIHRKSGTYSFRRVE